MLLILFSWQFFYDVDALDDDEDTVATEANNRNDNDDKSFTVIIPENAAWSQSIDQRFNPSNVTVPVGAEVTWINEDVSEHPRFRDWISLFKMAKSMPPAHIPNNDWLLGKYSGTPMNACDRLEDADFTTLPR